MYHAAKTAVKKSAALQQHLSQPLDPSGGGDVGWFIQKLCTRLFKAKSPQRKTRPAFVVWGTLVAAVYLHYKVKKTTMMNHVPPLPNTN